MVWILWTYVFTSLTQNDCGANADTDVMNARSNSKNFMATFVLGAFYLFDEII